MTGYRYWHNSKLWYALVTVGVIVGAAAVGMLLC